MLRRSTWLTLACTALLACTERGSEPYVRLRDPAPAALRSDGATLYAFWASWCAPCVAESAALAALGADPPAGLQVAIVAVQEDPAAAQRTFPGLQVLPDPAGKLAGEARVGELPAALLVKGGQTRARFDGAREWDAPAARATLARLLATEPPAVDAAGGGG